MDSTSRIGDDVLMAPDAKPGILDEAHRLSAALADGGEARMPLQATVRSPGLGMPAGRFGTPWMVNTAPAPE